jgi:alpha-L-fucosidase
VWPSAETNYTVKSSPWKNGNGDLVRDASNAARHYGMRFGVFLSPWDRHDPRYADAAAYDNYYLSQLTELATRYGDLAEFWLDGAGSAGRIDDFARIVEQLRTYQPNTLVFADVALFQFADLRWVGNESGNVTYEDWDVVDRAGYLRWRPHDEASLKSVAELVNTYNYTVGRGAQLMIGIAPDNTGRLPDVDAARLREFGEAIHKLYGHNLVMERQVHGEGDAALDGDPDTFWTP